MNNLTRVVFHGNSPLRNSYKTFTAVATWSMGMLNWKLAALKQKLFF
jgi:hypothetical protein